MDYLIEDRELIKDYVSFFKESSIEIYGIGLGYYPNGIRAIFSKCVWSVNPFLKIKALYLFFGNTYKHLEEIPYISFKNKNL